MQCNIHLNEFIVVQANYLTKHKVLLNENKTAELSFSTITAQPTSPLYSAPNFPSVRSYSSTWPLHYSSLSHTDGVQQEKYQFIHHTDGKRRQLEHGRLRAFDSEQRINSLTKSLLFHVWITVRVWPHVATQQLLNGIVKTDRTFTQPKDFGYDDLN